MSKLRQQLRQARITRGALIIAVAQLVVSLGYVFLDKSLQASIREWIVASPSQVFEHGRVWTLVTTSLIEPDFLSLILTLLMLWMFVPTLERFWGTARFYKFVAVTSIVGALAGCLLGLATGHDVPIAGLRPFVFGSIVAFGVIYARQPVEFSFYIRMTGRQMMFGFIGFLVLFVVIQGLWELGGAIAAAMVSAAIMTSKRWSPGLAWRRWKIARARARLTVLEGGAPKPQKRPDEQRWLN